MREQMKHLESFRFVLFHKVRNLEEERDPLEKQVTSLKSSVREMYDEFVRQFRQKQQLDQQVNDKSDLSETLQKENVDLRSKLLQLRKDGRHLLQDAETVLHAETQKDFEQMHLRLREVLEKHKKLRDWAPPVAEEGEDGDWAEHAQKEASMIEEMVTQRNLQFRKTQIAQSKAVQIKSKSTLEMQRLIAENAQLITEMNTLRNEKQSYQRTCKDYEDQIMELKAKNMQATREAKSLARKLGGHSNLSRIESAPSLSGPLGGETPGGADSSGGSARFARQASPSGGQNGSQNGQTPYMRRKVVDQQEQSRRQRQKQLNQLPPLQPSPGSAESGAPAAPAPAAAGAGSSGRSRPNAQEKRFSQTLESVQADRRQMEQQGFQVGQLGDPEEEDAPPPNTTDEGGDDQGPPPMSEDA
jgi:hypothetical protein